MSCCKKFPSLLNEESQSHNANRQTPQIFKSSASSSNHLSEQIEARSQGCINSTPTLVIDLDETLVHSEFDYTKKCETILKLPITVQTRLLQQDFNLNYIPCYLAVREGVRESIQQLSKYYDLILWTASYPDYANVIIDYLGVRQYFKKILYRQDCTIVEDGSRKDLYKLNLNPSTTLIIDNDINNFQLQPENGIEIADFNGKQGDTLFQELTSYLLWLVKQNIDFKDTSIKRQWK